MASGKMAGHMSEFAKLNRVRHQIEMLPGSRTVQMPRMTPKAAQTARAFS